jgi:O-antigen/teichoic acid export membrane protein
MSETEKSAGAAEVVDAARGRKRALRVDDRWRRASLTGSSTVVHQVVATIVGVITTPLAVHYLGAERYGIWLTAASLLGWLALADAGIGGNALVNAVAEAHGRRDAAWQRELVATAFWALALIAAVLAVMSLIAVPRVNWREVFRVSSATRSSELTALLAVCVMFFLCEFPTRVTNGVFHGTQKGYIANLWNLAGVCASVPALIAVSTYGGGLPGVAAAFWGPRTLANYGATLQYAVSCDGAAVFRLSDVSLRAARRLTRLGVRYVIGQFGAFAMLQSQPLVVARLLGPTEVAVFSVAQRLATMPTVVVSGLLNGLMPAYGEARVRRDWKWIERTFRYSVVFGVLTGLGAAAGILVLTRPIAAVWVGLELAPPRGLVGSLAAYVFLNSCLAPISVMLYGMERVGRQALIAVANGVLVVVLGWHLAGRWGVTGTGIAMVAAMAVTNLPAQVLEARRAFRDVGSSDVR